MRERRIYNVIDIQVLSYNLTEFLKDDFNPKVPENYSLKIYDDRIFINDDGIEKMVKKINYFFPNYCVLGIYNLNSGSYKKLLELKKNNNMTINYLTLNEYDVDLEPEILPVNIDIQDAAKVPVYNANKVIFGDYAKTEICRYFDVNVLSTEELLNSINYIANQIKQYANNDVQKILLLDKMLRENVSFDWYYISDEELQKCLKEEAKKEGFSTHISHSAQALLIKRNVVCSSIASFATILLRHPDLNINITNLNGTAYGGPHSFNKVELDGKKYTCDFTHNITRGFDDPLKHTLVKQPSKEHTINNSNFDEYETMDRKYLMSEYEKIKDIHIKMPEFKEASFNIKYTDNVLNKEKIDNSKNI